MSNPTHARAPTLILVAAEGRRSNKTASPNHTSSALSSPRRSKQSLPAPVFIRPLVATLLDNFKAYLHAKPPPLGLATLRNKLQTLMNYLGFNREEWIGNASFSPENKGLIALSQWRSLLLEIGSLTRFECQLSYFWSHVQRKPIMKLRCSVNVLSRIFVSLIFYSDVFLEAACCVYHKTKSN